ncbi:uncharacterized protein si:dkey-106l3.7 [Syngnathus scovelli]|uniref:uncharacterized protein si:dkey-106l3.7 n=1 Tax=Syngnathus scovelli TaxID=161590 RepID=UPI00211055B5|nr:uncharacterized protein si:dkey-106l3.7 [Syngnathus scovelli]
MNLYRSFGNLLEAWVAEQEPDTELLEDIPNDSLTCSSPSSSGLERNVRAESVDSGVETASTDTFCLTSSLSTEMAEMDSFASGNDNFSPFLSLGSASLPPCPPPAAISQPPRLSRIQGSVIFNTKLNQALQRSESRRLSESHTDNRHAVSRYRNPLLRSESFGTWETPKPSVSLRQILDMKKETLTSRSRMEPMQDRPEAFVALSPGLRYLEAVCKKWEDIAKQQLVKDGYHVDMAQDFGSYHSLDQPLCFHGARPEQPSNQELKDFLDGHFRQRSSSDTTVSSSHTRKLNLGSRGQQVSTLNLLDNEAQGDLTYRPNKHRKFKFLSLTRGSSSHQNSQLMQSSQSNGGRRQLGNLLRKRRQTLPISSAH